MKTKNNHEARKLVYGLSLHGDKIIESEYFLNTNYLLRDEHIIILAGSNGELAIHLDLVEQFVDELKEIVDEWKDIKTDRCLRLNDRRSGKIR